MRKVDTALKALRLAIEASLGRELRDDEKLLVEIDNGNTQKRVMLTSGSERLTGWGESTGRAISDLARRSKTRDENLEKAVV